MHQWKFFSSKKILLLLHFQVYKNIGGGLEVIVTPNIEGGGHERPPNC